VFESRRASVSDRLSLKISPARHDFKEMLGQNNHFLITIMVGLDAVANGEAHLNKDFSTSWAPHHPGRSAERSREFACKALTAWLTDAVAAYIRGLFGKPPIVTDLTLAERVRAADHLDDKICEIAASCAQSKSSSTLLVRAAVIWRNRLVHSSARNRIAGELSNDLLARKELLAAEYRGLDVQRLIDSAMASRAPTLKEVTSLVQAAHNYVSAVDAALLERVELDLYVHGILAGYVIGDPSSRISNVWGKDERRRLSSLIQICKQNGMTDYDEQSVNGTSECLIRDMSAWTPAEAARHLLSQEN
jgi:hypothetical protein